MSFDRIFDFTAGVYFKFYNIIHTHEDWSLNAGVLGVFGCSRIVLFRC